MKETKKKNHPADSDAVLDELAQIIIDENHAATQSELEPFEHYSHRIKSKIHADVEGFRNRFARGYQVLIEELKKNDPTL